MSRYVKFLLLTIGLAIGTLINVIVGFSTGAALWGFTTGIWVLCTIQAKMMSE